MYLSSVMHLNGYNNTPTTPNLHDPNDTTHLFPCSVYCYHIQITTKERIWNPNFTNFIYLLNIKLSYIFVAEYLNTKLSKYLSLIVVNISISLPFSLFYVKTLMIEAEIMIWAFILC